MVDFSEIKSDTKNRMDKTIESLRGDFGSLSGKIRFMSKEKITPEFIIRELQNIQSEKQKNGGRTIGFAS